MSKNKTFKFVERGWNWVGWWVGYQKSKGDKNNKGLQAAEKKNQHGTIFWTIDAICHVPRCGASNGTFPPIINGRLILRRRAMIAAVLGDDQAVSIVTQSLGAAYPRPVSWPRITRLPRFTSCNGLSIPFSPKITQRLVDTIDVFNDRLKRYKWCVGV